MTRPENPDPLAVTNGRLKPVVDETEFLPDLGEPQFSATRAETAPQDPSEESPRDKLPPDRRPSGEPAVEQPAAGELRSEEAPEASPVEDLPGGEPRGEGGINGSTATIPPWQRAGTSPPEQMPSAGSSQRGDLESSTGGEATQSDQQRPIGRAYGYPSVSGAGPAATSTRYGRPVAQPFDAQSSRGVGPDFSGPTVRIGGRVQPGQAPSQPSPSSRIRPTRIPRRTSLQLRYLEPWSVLKVSLVLSVAGFFAWMVAVGVLYNVLGNMGVWDQLNGTYSDLTSVSDPRASQDLISAGGVFGVAAVVGLVNIVLITAMCTVGAFIYNASADLAGGIEVTLSERD